VDADVAINAYMWQNGGHSGPDQWNFVMHPVYAAKKADPVRRPSRPLWRPF
jgi:deoxyribodipyrimidine photo-lyase